MRRMDAAPHVAPHQSHASTRLTESIRSIVGPACIALASLFVDGSAHAETPETARVQAESSESLSNTIHRLHEMQRQIYLLLRQHTGQLEPRHIAVQQKLAGEEHTFNKAWAAGMHDLDAAAQAYDQDAYGRSIAALDRLLTQWEDTPVIMEESPHWSEMYGNFLAKRDSLRASLRDLQIAEHTVIPIDQTVLCERDSVGRVSRTQMLTAEDEAYEERFSYYSSGLLRSIAQCRIQQETPVLQTKKIFWNNGRLLSVADVPQETFDLYGQSGSHLLHVEQTKTPGKKENFIITRHGEPFGAYPTERNKNPALTTEQYLDQLADALKPKKGETTPYERLAVFFAYFFEYRKDGPIDTWQTPAETLTRMENGKMLGDCDDQAFLCQALHKRWGNRAHVVFIPKHYTCVWLHQITNGRYHACSCGTYGFDIDGHQYFESLNEYRDLPGHPTPESAMEALLKKFQEPDVQLSPEYTFDPQRIHVIEFNAYGNQQFTTKTIRDFLPPS